MNWDQVIKKIFSWIKKHFINKGISYKTIWKGVVLNNDVTVRIERN